MTLNLPNFFNFLRPKTKEKSIYPDFPKRLLATLLDITIFYLIVSPLGYLLSLIIFAGPSPSTQLHTLFKNFSKSGQTNLSSLMSSSEYINIVHKYGYGSIVFEQALQLGLFAIAMIICLKIYRSTPGKMIMGIKLVDYDSRLSPSMIQYIIRGVAAFFSILPLGIGYIPVLWSKEKRALHDIISSTVIINNDPTKTNGQ